MYNTLKRRIQRSPTGRRILNDKKYRMVLFALGSLCLNLLYAIYNGVLGLLTGSLWFVSMCAYHIILTIMRVRAVANRRRKKKILKSTGILLSLLSLVLVVIVYLSVSQDMATRYGEIIMITIATYTFTKITMAVIRAIKGRNENSAVMSVIRNIGYAEIAVSVLTMQMSMLVSFEEGSGAQSIYILNLLTGIGVCVFTLTLGICLILKSKRK